MSRRPCGSSNSCSGCLGAAHMTVLVTVAGDTGPARSNRSGRDADMLQRQRCSPRAMYQTFRSTTRSCSTTRSTPVRLRPRISAAFATLVCAVREVAPVLSRELSPLEGSRSAGAEAPQLLVIGEHATRDLTTRRSMARPMSHRIRRKPSDEVMGGGAPTIGCVAQRPQLRSPSNDAPRRRRGSCRPHAIAPTAFRALHPALAGR